MGLFKTTITTSSKACIRSMEIKGKLFSTAQDIANEVNSFFTNIGQQLADKIPSQDISHFHFLRRQNDVTSKFTFTHVNPQYVFKHLYELDSSKASGPDDIPSKLLKLAVPMNSDSLSYLFNLSLQTGNVPTDWKLAKVSVIYKKGSKLDISNNRPISVLPVLSKILEKNSTPASLPVSS